MIDGKFESVTGLAMATRWGSCGVIDGRFESVTGDGNALGESWRVLWRDGW